MHKHFSTFLENIKKTREEKKQGQETRQKNSFLKEKLKHFKLITPFLLLTSEFYETNRKIWSRQTTSKSN